MEELTLFKNIRNEPSSFVSFESKADVRIWLSYTNSSFVKSQDFVLYDSKCRKCDKKITTLLPVSIQKLKEKDFY